MKQNAPAKSQGLNDKVIDEVIGRFRKIGGQNIRYAHRILGNQGNNSDGARCDSREQHELDKKEDEIKILCDDLTFTTRRCPHKDSQFS